MTGLEKTEQQIEKFFADLVVVRERKADILEKEKQIEQKLEELKNQRILQIVGSFNLTGDDLKERLSVLVARHSAEIKQASPIINNGRKNENEETQ